MAQCCQELPISQWWTSLQSQWVPVNLESTFWGVASCQPGSVCPLPSRNMPSVWLDRLSSTRISLLYILTHLPLPPFQSSYRCVHTPWIMTWAWNKLSSGQASEICGFIFLIKDLDQSDGVHNQYGALEGILIKGLSIKVWVREGWCKTPGQGMAVSHYTS